MLQLEVINEMLGTMGEAPLATLTAPHTLRGAAQRVLKLTDEAVQARGWWFNRETMTLQPSGVDGTVYLPGDAIGARLPKSLYGRYAERAGRLYNLEAGDWVRVKVPDVQIIRQVPFDDLPTLASDAIGLRAIVKFQRDYDGDSQKTRDIRGEAADSWASMQAEETRQVRANRIYSNPRLARIKAMVFARRYG